MPSHQNEHGETPVDVLRRTLAALANENEFVLDSLPTQEAVVDYVSLLKTYDAFNLVDIGMEIEDGADPNPYNAFLDRYSLTWRRHQATRIGKTQETY